MVCHEVEGTGVDACNLANGHQKQGQGQDVATDNGVEAPSHKESFWEQSFKIDRLSGRAGECGGLGQAEDCEDGNAYEVCPEDV